MNLLDKIHSIAQTSKLRALSTGKAKDFNELWENIIEPNLPNETAVIGWHNVLMNYIKEPDAIFFMRAYGSPSGNSKMLRRGFLNKTNYNFSAFYGDNFFTSYFYSMALDGYVPSQTEFIEVMKNRKFPCGFIQTTEEKNYAAYYIGKNPGITTKGYKIAHIFSSGENFNSKVSYSSIGEFCNNVFPRSINTDWSAIDLDTYGQYHYRKVLLKDATEALEVHKFLVAHFLRTVHPINYFLVPNKPNRYDKDTGILKTNIYWYDGGVEKDEIGESTELIEYVAEKIKAKYGKIYDEFLSLIYPTCNINPKGQNKSIDATYGIDIWKIKSTISNKTPFATNKASCKTKTTSRGSRVKPEPTPGIKFNQDINGYKEYLEKRNYNPMPYVSAIKGIMNFENLSFDEILDHIDLLIKDYEKDGVKKLLGDNQHGGWRNALRRLKDFKNYLGI